MEAESKDKEKFELNESQRRAVEYYDKKPLLIEAGPGSGKTRVIVERVKFLVEKGMDPESFLIITFSNKAANELKERLGEYFEDDPDIVNRMQISTVHSFCYKLLLDNTSRTYKILDDNYGTKKNMFIYKHRERLGFKRESTLSRGKVKDVVTTFEKYSTFNVDTDRLVKWVEENEPVSQDYLDFIDEEFRRTGRFPRRKIELDKKKKNLKSADDYHAYADNWYNALHLQTAKAYKEYLKLLDENNYLDFNVLQMKARDYLREHPQTQYKNILVDEFQDTDPVQIEIFEILMKNALNPRDFSKDDGNSKEEIDEVQVNNYANPEEEIEKVHGKNDENTEEEIDRVPENSNEKLEASFTAVGDIDQSIYGFRGALEDYFQYFYDKYDTERIGLNVNYRSTNEIIEFSERYIAKQRKKDSRKQLKGDRNESRKIYYIENDEPEMEAAAIAKIIKGLKENELIEGYNDVAILLRSVVTYSKDIITVFEDERIPFQVKGLQDLDNKDEIRSILTLLHFIVDDEKYVGIPVISDWETEWLNLRAFTNADFKQKIVNLTEETQEILIKKQKDFEDTVFELGKSIYSDMMGKKCRKRSYKGILELEDEILEEVFRFVRKPIITRKALSDYGITDADDLAFFNRLLELKSRIFSQDFDQRPTILDVYYEILEICGFLDEEYVFDEANKEALEYIGLFTQIIYEYENIISDKDIRGLYWFLNSNIKNYSYDIEDEEGVNIMTIHKSKGLEFPVVIVGALNDSTFPREYENLKEIKYKNGSAVFYTPRECFGYKFVDKDDVLLHYEEEERNIYVAITRAQDLLILSKNNKAPRKTTYSKSLQKEIDDYELKERMNRISEEIEELKEKSEQEDVSFVLDDLKQELKSIKAELKEVKPLIKEHKGMVKESKRLNELIIELRWKINDLKYESMVLDELIELLGLDKDDSSLNRDEIRDMILNAYGLDGDGEDNQSNHLYDYEKANENNLDEKDNINDNFNDNISENRPLNENINENRLLNDNIDENNILNDNINENRLLNDNIDENNLLNENDALENESHEIDRPVDDFFEDKEPLQDILSRSESGIFDLKEDMSKEDDKVTKIIEKLIQLQDSDLQSQKSKLHLNYKIEIQKVMDQAIEENDDMSLSKSEVVLNGLFSHLRIKEGELKETNEIIERGTELLSQEKRLNNKKSYLEYKIDMIKDQDAFDVKYDLQYDLTSQERFIVIRDLEKMAMSVKDDPVHSLSDLYKLRDVVSSSENPQLLKDSFANKDLVELVSDDDSFFKLEALFKIRDYENIEDISDIGILKDREDCDEKTLRLFMSLHYKNLEIENRKRLEFISSNQTHLSSLIFSYEGVEIIDSGNIHRIFKQSKIPNTAKTEENRNLFLSYSSIEAYESCPLKYYLSYNCKFKISDNVAINLGNINHNSLEEINKLIIERKERYAKDNGIEIGDIEGHLLSRGKEMDNELFISRQEMTKIIERIYYENPNVNRKETDIEDVKDNLFDYWERHGRGFDILESEYRFDIADKCERLTLIGSIDLLYRTEDGLVILDYKTTQNISEDARKKYKKQLYTYALALKDDSLYNEDTLDKLQIYAIKSQDLLHFELKEEDFEQRENEIREIAKNIRDNHYPSKTYNEHSNDCHYCKYSFICKNTLLKAKN